MPYVYMHIRKDKNEPFYIGIGRSDDNYKRASSKKNRNRHWHNIVGCTEYEVSIVKEKISWEEACELEKQLILKYGKKSCGGILCNIADGGEGGNLGPDVSKIMSERRQGHNNNNAYKVYQYTLDGEFVREWACAKYAADHYGISHTNISDCLAGRQKTAVKFKWSKTKLHEE